MSLPTSPTNGQSATLNGVTYVYDSASGSWSKVTSGSGTIPTSVSGTLTVSGAATLNSTLSVSGAATVGNVVTTNGIFYPNGATAGGTSVPVGSGGDQIFFLNQQTVNNSYSIPANTNAGSFGPVTIGSGATVTIPSTSTWTIV
jgi:hypothetical protein